jgi:hypothetical protein
LVHHQRFEWWYHKHCPKIVQMFVYFWQVCINFSLSVAGWQNNKCVFSTYNWFDSLDLLFFEFKRVFCLNRDSCASSNGRVNFVSFFRRES